MVAAAEILKGIGPEVWAAVPPAVAAIFLKIAGGLRVTETTVRRRRWGKLIINDEPLEATEKGLKVEDDALVVVSFSNEQTVTVKGPHFGGRDPFAVVINEQSRTKVRLPSGGDYQPVANGVVAKYVPDE